MVAVPTWLRGPGITTLTITPQDAAADGTLTDDALGALNIRLRLNSVRLEMRVNSQNISPVTSGRMNDVVLEDGQYVTLEELLVHDGTSAPSLLALTAYEWGYAKIIFARGGKTWTLYCSRGTYSEQTNGKGEVRATLELNAADAGASSIAYA